MLWRGSYLAAKAAVREANYLGMWRMRERSHRNFLNVTLPWMSLDLCHKLSIRHEGACYRDRSGMTPRDFDAMLIMEASPLASYSAPGR
jgi:hypothetical protein